MSDIIAKTTARGISNGIPLSIEFVEQRTNDGSEIHAFRNGKEDIDLHMQFLEQTCKMEANDDSDVPAYRIEANAIESYWIILHNCDLFDEPPEITIEGDVDIFGSPYDDWTKPEYDGVVF